MSNPFFSILIPCFNSREYIKETLASCFDQKCIDYEIIICDNSSNDNISVILEEYQKNNLKYFLGKTQASMISLRNFLIEQSNGKYIVWLEPGDKLTDDFLQEAYILLNNKHYDILQFKSIWELQDTVYYPEENTEIDYSDFNCIDIYFDRDDMNQDSLWGKIISSQIMKISKAPELEFVLSAEEVLYSVILYLNAKTYKKINTNACYIYNSLIDHFHGLSELNLNNIKYMCKLRNEQLKHNLNLLKTYEDKYKLKCLEKIYLFSIFNDILNLKDLEERKEALNEFYKYFNLKLSSNIFYE